MRVLVTGSRTWPTASLVWHRLDELYEDAKEEGSESFTVVHGDCPSGADLFARQWCQERQVAATRAASATASLPVIHEPHPARWYVEGKVDKGAGFKRNAEMVALGADWCLAFIVNHSKGATHTMRLAQQAGILGQLDEINTDEGTGG